MEFKESFPSRKRRRSFGPRAGKRARKQFRRLASRGELKFLDTTKAATASATTGTLLDDSLVHIAQDASENGRIGRKVVIKALHLKGIITFSSTATLTQTNNAVRVIIFWDKQANGAAATMSEIINSSGTVDYLSFRDLSNSGRFKILYDHSRPLNSQAVLQDAAGTGDNLPQTFLFNVNWKCNIPIEYDSSAADGSLATIRSNNIGIMTVCHEAAVAPTIEYNCRVRFVDG